MDDRHLNREKYFHEQSYTTEKYVIPFINKLLPITSNLTIAEVGCGEGGNLKPFLDIIISKYALYLLGGSVVLTILLLLLKELLHVYI